MKFIVILCLLLGTACSAKRMRGEEARSVAGPPVAHLKATAQVEPALSLDRYVLVDIYLQNFGDDWLRAKSISVTGVEGAERFRVILGPDLKAWRKSVALDFDLRIETEKNAAKRAQLLAQKARLTDYADEDHLYQPSSVPAQLQTRKWILFQFDNRAVIKNFRFEVSWMNDQKQTFEVLIAKEVRP